MEKNKTNYFKFLLALVLCLFVRLIPFRAPNIEPILATAMPFSKVYGAIVSFSFVVLSILLYDFISGTFGVQTFFILLAYGVLGIWSANYFKKREANVLNYVRFAIIGTLFFDAVTGLTIGPLFFHQTLFTSLIDQIPFTVLHLLGNITFAIILSPAIYKILIKKKKFTMSTINQKEMSIINIFNPTTN